MAKQAVFTLAQMGGAVNALVFIYKQCKSLVTTAGQSASSLKDAFSQGLAPALVDEARHVVIDAYIASTSTSTSTSESSTVSDMASSLSLGSVVGLDWKIGMGIMSDSCNNLKAPFVSVVWKIGKDNLVCVFILFIGFLIVMDTIHFPQPLVTSYSRCFCHHLSITSYLNISYFYIFFIPFIYII